MPTEPNSPEEDYVRRRVKAELRKRMRGVRAQAPLSACQERSAAIVSTLLAHEAIVAASSVALFFPIEARHEVDLRSLDAALRARGASVFYPAIDPDTRVMTFRKVSDLAELEERGLGFAEPSATAEEAEPGALSAIVVPALAIDTAGHRIGYGAGFYDRTLPRFAPPAITLGVAYDYQLIPEVPTTEGDVPLAWVVTDRRVFRAGGPAWGTPIPSPSPSSSSV
jgi:5-formyltetrahydrofolate cyclo-ligase